MKKEYLDQPTKGVWCKPTRSYPINNGASCQQPVVMTGEGNAAFPVSPNLRRPHKDDSEMQYDEKKESHEYTEEELNELFRWIIIRTEATPERQRYIDVYVKQRINFDEKINGRTYGPLERKAVEKYIRADIEYRTKPTPDWMLGDVEKVVGDAALEILIAHSEDEKNMKNKTLSLGK